MSTPNEAQCNDWITQVIYGNRRSKLRYALHHPVLAFRFWRALRRAFPA